MKYEYLCGHESDFFTMPAEVIAVVRLDYCVQGLTEFSQIVECGKPVLAMRRIIKEPKRWTLEDKKAGVSPEVGAKCRQGHKDEIVIAVTEKFVVTECQDMSVCTTRKDVFMRSYNPIETIAAIIYKAMLEAAPDGDK